MDEKGQHVQMTHSTSHVCFSRYAVVPLKSRATEDFERYSNSYFFLQVMDI